MCAKFIYNLNLKHSIAHLGILRQLLTKNYEVARDEIYGPHSLCWPIYFCRAVRVIQAPCNVPFYTMEDRQREILSF